MMDKKYIYEEQPGKILLMDENHQQIGEITYQDAGEGIMIIDHTGVNSDYRGQGLAAELVRKAVEVAIRDNKKVVPLCPYALREFEKNEEYQKCQYNK